MWGRVVRLMGLAVLSGEHGRSRCLRLAGPLMLDPLCAGSSLGRAAHDVDFAPPPPLVLCECFPRVMTVQSCVLLQALNHSWLDNSPIVGHAGIATLSALEVTRWGDLWRRRISPPFGGQPL